MKLKEIQWTPKDGRFVARIMGVTMSVFANEHGGYDCRLVNGVDRPETETNFKSATDAMRHAEEVLLKSELKKYFTGVDYV